MGKKKEKPYEGILIDFANSKLGRIDVFNIILGRLGSLSRVMESRADIRRIKNYKPSDKKYFEELKEYYELEFESRFFPTRNPDNYNHISKIFKNLTGKDFISFPMSTREVNKALSNSEYKEISITLKFYYSLKYFQLKLRDILKKIINNVELDMHSLSLIDDGYHKNRQKFEISRSKTYFKKITIINSFEIPVACLSNPYFLFEEYLEPVVCFCLGEFLCSPDWKKLKQCKECGKFFVAKVVRDDIKHCSKKCKQANWNRVYKESGKHAEYMRKKRPEKSKWIT